MVILEGESVDCFLLHCEISIVLRNDVFAKVGLVCVKPRRIVIWQPTNCSSPIYLVWCIWRKINDKSFEDHEWTIEKFHYFVPLSSFYTV